MNGPIARPARSGGRSPSDRPRRLRALLATGRARRPLDALVFPLRSARSATPTTGGPPFCAACRAELLEARRAGLPPLRDAGRAVRGPDRGLLGVPGAVARVRRGDRPGAVPGADPRPLPEAQARAERLARPLAGRAAGRGAAGRRSASEAEAGAWVVPVPLHWRRRLRRGYNQAEALARGLARRLGRWRSGRAPAGGGDADAGPGRPGRAGRS